MRKILISLVMFILIQMLPVFSLVGVGNNNSYFTDDFENKENWESLVNDGWMSSNGAPITIQTEGTNKYLNIVTQWGTNLFKQFDTPVTGFVGIEMDMAINDPSISHFGLVDKNGSTVNVLFFEKVGDVNKVRFVPNWSLLPWELSDDEWVRVKMVVDVANSKCFMWITKQGKNQEAVFLGWQINSLNGGLKGIIFAYPASYSWHPTGNNFKLDNVSIYKQATIFDITANIQVGNQSIVSGKELYQQKETRPQVKVTASRMFYDSAFDGDIYYVLYQGNRVIDLQKGDIAFGIQNDYVDIIFDMNLSLVTTTDLKVKIFFWGKTNWEPLAVSKQLLQDEIQIFVSEKDGEDSNSGDQALPVKTIGRAKEIARGYKNNEVNILVAEGDYFENIYFDALDQRERAFPLEIQPVGNDRVRLIGAASLNASNISPILDHSVLDRIPAVSKDQVKQIDLKSQGITDYGEIVPIHYGEPSVSPPELFINGAAMTLSRWPNGEYARIGSIIEQTDAGFTFSVLNAQEKAKSWAGANDAWVYGFWYWDWLNEGFKVKEINAQSGAITTLSNTQVRAGQKFYIYNLLEELDIPGEFFLDRESGMLYVYPVDNISIADDILFSMSAEPLLKFTNTQNIHIKGLEIGYTRERGILIENCDSLLIENCKVHFTGQVGIQANNTTNLTVSGCTITDTGAGGVLCTGGNLETLTPSNNLFTNNHVYNYSRIIKSYTPAFRINGVGTTVSHNLIHDAEHVGIMYNGNDHIIEYNEIYNVCNSTDDSGAIYTGQSWTERGNIIRYNYLHDIIGPAGGYGVNGVYLDDVHSSTQIYGNIFYKVSRPVLVGGGRDNIIENNLILEATSNSTASIIIDQRGVEEWFQPNVTPETGICYKNLANVPYRSDIWRQRYPKLYNILDNSPREPRGNIVRNNVVYKHKELGISPLALNYGEIRNNFLTNSEDIGFVDYENKNFALEENSIIWSQIPEFKSIPFDKIGLID